MRGKAAMLSGDTTVTGITPAYAGKSRNVFRSYLQKWDHPRLCGEKQQLEYSTKLDKGSPPPMRGKETSGRNRSAAAGITPAYAGKSCRSILQRRIIWDHPRLCGEKSICYDSTRPCLGSPPPMRGKADCMTFCRFRRRITPAYAGKSSLFPRSSVILEDHPRLCGEKPPSACTGGRCGGSPPPMRGKDLSAGQLRRNHRITPAYAGKSCNRFRTSGSGGDHPRLCGEKCGIIHGRSHFVGSPPPMRGKGRVFCHAVSVDRITPAYAGKRPWQSF